MWALSTCGEPNDIKKNTHPKHVTALFCPTCPAARQAECSKLGLPFDGKINNWDSSYYRNMVEKEHYQVDHEEIKTYFPLERVTTGLLDIYQELLSLVFVPVSTGTWHEEVVCYRVEDKATKATMGHFYLDLHPREGKYGHAACWGLQPGCKISETKRMLPVAACVCNFTKGTKEAPSLMMHSEVETFFHEFGHCMHQLCSEADFSRFAGTAVERDFVEAPSQMLENWCWQPNVLNKLSRHHQTGEPLPSALLDKLIAAKNVNSGFSIMRQVYLGKLDLAIHSETPPATSAELQALVDELCPKISLVRNPPNCNMLRSFGHLMNQYVHVHVARAALPLSGQWPSNRVRLVRRTCAPRGPSARVVNLTKARKRPPTGLYFAGLCLVAP